MGSQVQAPVFAAGPLGQPDIGYTPDHERYLARRKRRIATETLTKSLPPGFPERLESELVWDGNDLAGKYNWNYVLNDADVAEIKQALAHFKCQCHPSVPLNFSE
jgi:hypothetical protein